MLVALGVMWHIREHPAALPACGSRCRFTCSACCCCVCVALFGEIVNGARRWLHIGVTRIQPSELMKIAVPLMLAWYFDRYEATLKLKNYIIAALLLIVPVGLIARQPDLGTALLIFAPRLLRAFSSPGLSWRDHRRTRHRRRREPAVAVVSACTTTSASAS